MKINYKITTYILLFIVLIMSVCAIIVSQRDFDYMHTNAYSSERRTSGGHMMSDGSFMGDRDNWNMENQMTSMSMNLNNKSGKELEKTFLIEMIPHHMGAVEMAKIVVLDKTVNAEIRQFAENIISAQEAEISLMKTWLQNYK